MKMRTKKNVIFVCWMMVYVSGFAQISEANVFAYTPSNVPPDNPELGWTFYDKENRKVYQYNGYLWRPITDEIVIDPELSNTSENPVSNKAIFKALQELISFSGTQLSYTTPYQRMRYRFENGMVTSLNDVVLDADMIAIKTIDDRRSTHLLIRNRIFSAGISKAFFMVNERLVYISASRPSLTFGAKVPPYERMLGVVINTTPDTTFGEVPEGYSLFAINDEYQRPIVAGSTRSEVYTINFSYIR